MPLLNLLPCRRDGVHIGLVVDPSGHQTKVGQRERSSRRGGGGLGLGRQIRVTYAFDFLEKYSEVVDETKEVGQKVWNVADMERDLPELPRVPYDSIMTDGRVFWPGWRSLTRTGLPF
ncbi:unnamed protein product [Phytophthora lilii]|uniref:Unnamed protein product n=1 Tax=Phytophthora lilii TaxID=2077276 RepID=A0A9W6TC80_9STRA|nr:unnamed protein product [Phytophthora lilii]